MLNFTELLPVPAAAPPPRMDKPAKTQGASVRLLNSKSLLVNIHIMLDGQTLSSSRLSLHRFSHP